MLAKEELVYFLIKTLSPVMDAYMLSRIFKKFSKGENCYPEEPNNIVIYAGASHCQTYEKFLLQNNFYKIEEATSTLQNCVDIINISQPFFKDYEPF